MMYRFFGKTVVKNLPSLNWGCDILQHRRVSPYASREYARDSRSQLREFSLKFLSRNLIKPAVEEISPILINYSAHSTLYIAILLQRYTSHHHMCCLRTD